jgi:hypothetical protein
MTGAASRSKSNKATPPAALSSPNATDLPFLGAPPLIPGESARDYRRLLNEVIKVMKPADFLEIIWIRDIVDLQWDIIRFRRIKADLITHFYEECRERSGENGETVLKTVAKLVVDITKIDRLERIDRMVMTMEARRNAAYREAERHRIGLGERLRQATEQVEDAEFREVDDAPGEQKRVA